MKKNPRNSSPIFRLAAAVQYAASEVIPGEGVEVPNGFAVRESRKHKPENIGDSQAFLWIDCFPAQKNSLRTVHKNDLPFS
jgi:hypothetical protein